MRRMHVILEVTITGLRVVQEVAARGSFTAAADALDYTQSAVSRQVAAMEQAVGSRLFERQPRGVSPTRAGRVLLAHGAGILDRVESASLELSGLRDRVEGRLTLGAFPTALAVLVPRTLERLRSGHPGLVVAISEGGTPAQLRRLRAGRIEVAIVAVGDGLERYDLDDLRADLVLEGALATVAVGSDHRLAGREGVDVAELEGESWIVGAGEGPQFGLWPQAASEPTIAFTVRDWPGRIGLVAAGLGIALVPRIMAEAMPANVELVTVHEPNPTRRATLAVSHSDRSRNAAALVDALRAQGALMGT